MDTNLRGVMQLVRAVFPHMIQDDFGDIVNISSQAGNMGTPMCLPTVRPNSAYLATQKRFGMTCASQLLTSACSIFVRDWSM